MNRAGFATRVTMVSNRVYYGFYYGFYYGLIGFNRSRNRSRNRSKQLVTMVSNRVELTRSRNRSNP